MERQGYGYVFEVDTSGTDEDEEQKPLLEELEIDLDDISDKVRWALLPPKAGVGLVSDFWGPLFVLTAYAALLVWGEIRVVSWILSIWIVGGGLVFFLARVLGADVTLSHTYSSLGYCVLPLTSAYHARTPPTQALPPGAGSRCSLIPAS